MVQVQIKLMITTPSFYITKLSWWISTILYQQKLQKSFALLGLTCKNSIKFPYSGQPLFATIG